MTIRNYSHIVKYGSVSSRYDPNRVVVINGKTYKGHDGIDLAGKAGTPVYTPANGEVIFAEWANGYGNTVIIAHPNAANPTSFTLYAHLSKIPEYFQKPLQAEIPIPVSANQFIGLTGNTGGVSTGPHLHYEERAALVGLSQFGGNPSKLVAAFFDKTKAISLNPDDDNFGFAKVDLISADGSRTVYRQHTILEQSTDGSITHTFIGSESNTTTRTLPGGVVETQVYNRLTQVTEVTRTHEDSDNPGQALVDRYSVDAQGRLTGSAAVVDGKEYNLAAGEYPAEFAARQLAEKLTPLATDFGVSLFTAADSLTDSADSQMGEAASRTSHESTAPANTHARLDESADATSLSRGPRQPRVDENGMPLPEVKEGAAYDSNSDPVYQTLVTAFRDAQQVDNTIPADATQFADASDGTARTDAGSGIAAPATVPESNLTVDDANHALSQNASQTLTDAQTAASWSTANSYAQGTQSALSFIQALEQGNEFSATVAGVSMLNAFARASGITDPSNLPFSSTTTSSLGAVSAAFNLRDALKADDNLAALAAGSNLSSQASFVYASYAESAAAETLARNLGTAAGALGIANSLKNGDEVGAGASALMLASQLSWIGPWGTAVGLAIGIARALFGGDDPPEPRGTAEVRWNADGSLSVAVTEDDDGGGKSAQGMMQSMLDTLNGYLGQQTDAYGDPSFALIPQRLPTVSFFQREYAEFMLNYTDEQGQRITRHYNGQGQRIGLDGSVESTFAEDFLDEVLSQNAIVPKWEADTVRARINHGDPDAWKESADGPSLARGPRLDPIGDETVSIPEAVKGGLMALTFHLPGAPSPSFPLPEGEGGEPGALRARFDLSGDTYLDPVDWTHPYQAFLALDRDQNGIIDSGRELITFKGSPSPRPSPARGEGELEVARPTGSARNSLHWLDANNDGVLNSSDPAFGVLRLWLDINSNAHTDEGELASLSQLGITAIDFTQSPPMIVDAEGNTQPLTPKHLIPKGEGARIANDAGGTQIELQDGYKAMYLRAGDQRIQSVAPSPTVQAELARHTSNMSREAQGLFGGNAALLTGLAVAQTAAAGNVPASPLTLADVEHAIAAAQNARTLATDGSRHHGVNTAPTPTLPHEGGGSASTQARLVTEPGRVHDDGADPNTQYLAPNVQEGTPDYPLSTNTGTGAPAFTNPLTTGEIIAGSEDTALILTPAALLANDFSRNSNATLRISAVGNATRGTVALLDTGEVVFTPELNYFGPASFTYTVTDQWGYSTQAPVTLNLASVNDAPIIEAIEFGRPIFGYQIVRQYSVDWQPDWNYDNNTGEYYQDTLQAVNRDTTAQGLLATQSLLDSGGNVLTPTYYPQSGQLRPIAFDPIDATNQGFGSSRRPLIDDPTRMQGRVIAYDIDGDSSQITYSLGGNPAHGHAAVGWMASAEAPKWPFLPPDQLGNYAQYMYGAWQYASQPGDGYTGSDPFRVAVTDGEGGVTMATVSAWHHGTNQGGGGKKPVALDLDGNGLDFVGLDDSNVYFDVNGDGWREHIAWAGANDGLLVLDTEGDRVIDKPEEIAFARYYPGAVTDLEGLKAFDENQDGILDKLDARYKDFAVWQDKNQNGLSEDGEVLTLAERNIDSINLTSDQIPQTLKGGDIQLFGTGTYTTADGQTHALGDAMFRYTNEIVPPAQPTDPATLDQAEIMRRALVFTQMSAAFGADTTAEPLAGIDTTAGDTPIVTYDDPTGLVPGGKT